jgi:hypothetical protein
VTDTSQRPSFTGLLVHRDLTFKYSFLIPEGWHRLEIDGDVGNGVLCAPSPDDPLTGFSAEARDLETEITADDLTTLRNGFLGALRKLPESRIESREAEAIGRLITIEARHTYRDGDAIRKRWVRVLYQGSTQVRLIAQGATVGAFDYWLPMFFEAMRTFRFGDWWADVIGVGWTETVFNEDAGNEETAGNEKRET